MPLVREAGRTGPAPIYVEEDLERDLPPVARSLEVLPDPARYVELDAGTSPTAVPGTSADGTVWSEPPVVHEDGPPERTPLRAERIDIGPPPVARDPVDIRRIAPFFVGLMILLLVAYVWSVA